MLGLKNWIKFYKSSCDAVAAIEAAMIFPIMLTLMLGTLDLGRGIMSNQKTIKASQIVADLITRDSVVNTAMINEAITAGALSILPYDDENLKIEIISVRFLDDGTPEIVWREPESGPMILNDVTQRVMPLSAPGEGVVVVSAQYKYEPIFSSVVVDEIPMLEVAFARGRKGPVVCREGAPTC
jgi:hypothetical protein